MKERPILFNGVMVRAILEGRKTQTRRIVKPQPSNPKCTDSRWAESFGDDTFRFELTNIYGLKHDCLWVRETMWRNGGYVATDKPNIKNDGKIPSIFMPRVQCRIILEITDIRIERLQDMEDEDALAEGIEEYTGIVGVSGAGGSHHEIMGTRYGYKQDEFEHEYAIDAFTELWNSIYEKRGFGWDENLWVWIVEFKKVA